MSKRLNWSQIQHESKSKDKVSYNNTGIPIIRSKLELDSIKKRSTEAFENFQNKLIEAKKILIGQKKRICPVKDLGFNPQVLIIILSNDPNSIERRNLYKQIGINESHTTMFVNGIYSFVPNSLVEKVKNIQLKIVSKKIALSKNASKNLKQLELQKTLLLVEFGENIRPLAFRTETMSTGFVTRTLMILVKKNYFTKVKGKQLYIRTSLQCLDCIDL
jgi:hypothetical protein